MGQSTPEPFRTIGTIDGLPRPVDVGIVFLLAFGAALLAALFLTRALRARAPRMGLMSRPSGDGAPAREPVAVVGGLAIALAVWAVGTVVSYATRATTLHPEEAGAIIPVLLGAAAMVLVGVWDDLRPLRARTKLLFQVLIAGVVFAAGIRVGSLTFPVFGHVIPGVVPSLLLTILWFVGIANAFNLVDGADGVAGGAALAAVVSMFVVSLVLGQPLVALVLAVTAGAVLGFLHFNFPPATVFLGDAGSLSLGFLLAGLGLVSSSKATTALAIAIPVVALGLPITDTALAIARRLLKGQGITKRDLGHIHHRLRKLGHSPRRVALLLYAVCGLMALASLILLSPDNRAIGITFLVVGIAVFFGVQRLRFPELMELRRVLDQGLRQREIIGRGVAIREAVSELHDARDLPQVFESLSAALRGADCDDAEMWLAPEFAERDGAEGLNGALSEEDGAYVWRWAAEPEATNGGQAAGAGNGGPTNGDLPPWEISIPFHDPATGDLVGRLKLHRAFDGHMPADLRLVANELLPEMWRAAERLEGVRAAVSLEAERDAGAA